MKPIEFALTHLRPASVESDALVVGIFDEQLLTTAAMQLDEASNGFIKRRLDAGDISGKLGAIGKLFDLPGVVCKRVIVIGLGEQKRFDAARFARVNADAAKALKGGAIIHAVSYLSECDVNGRDINWRLLTAAIVTDAHCYRYSTTLKNKNGEKFSRLQLIAPETTSSLAIERAHAIASGVRLCKELGNLPPNICNPAYLAQIATQIALNQSKVTLEVLETAEMEKLGMGSLLGVARGSANAPKLIVLKYQGLDATTKPYVLVGKGITFDTGGISIKPGAGMEEMRFDMLGAASVLGTFLSVIKMQLPINLVALAVAVENMPDGDAYRPGDVLTSMSGQTIEVVNTDAEGRLILCDALTYAQRFEPIALVDVATLTGACVVALGKHASGLMSKHDDLANELLSAGETSLDRAWRLPLWDDYQPQIDSAFADMANVGGKNAGAITAGCFLARFTEGQRWAHLDIAGSSWDEGRKGMATGRPVMLLTQWLMDRVR